MLRLDFTRKPISAMSPKCPGALHRVNRRHHSGTHNPMRSSQAFQPECRDSRPYHASYAHLDLVANRRRDLDEGIKRDITVTCLKI